MAARYHFLTMCSLTSDREAVWAALVAVDEWPTWWRCLKRVDVVRAATGADGMGAIYRNHVQTPTWVGEFEARLEALEALLRRTSDTEALGDLG